MRTIKRVYLVEFSVSEGSNGSAPFFSDTIINSVVHNSKLRTFNRFGHKHARLHAIENTKPSIVHSQRSQVSTQAFSSICNFIDANK